MIYGPPPLSGLPKMLRGRTEKGGGWQHAALPIRRRGELASYSDFEGHTSSIRYEARGLFDDHYFKILTDARMHETRIKKDVIAGAVLAVTRGSAPPVTYDYTDANNPYYLASKTDENTKVTYYDRNGNNANRIWQIRYPDNGFGNFHLR